MQMQVSREDEAVSREGQVDFEYYATTSLSCILQL